LFTVVGGGNTDACTGFASNPEDRIPTAIEEITVFLELIALNINAPFVDFAGMETYFRDS
jgi:hypothetical protein